MKDVTFYIPVYNAAGYLREVLSAVFRQSYPIKEVLLIDDGSTDDSVDVALSAAAGAPTGLRVVRHPRNLGLGVARNTAIREASTDLLASVDADVAPEEDWLRRVVELVDGPDVAGAGGCLIERFVETAADHFRNTFMRQCWGTVKQQVPSLFGSNTVFRTEVLREVGGYNALCRTNGEDDDLSARLTHRAYRMLFTPDARCHHLRRDTVLSIMNTWWRWNYYCMYDVVPTSGKTVWSTARNFRRVGRMLAQSLRARDTPSMAVVALLPFYRTYKDWRTFWTMRYWARNRTLPRPELSASPPDPRSTTARPSSPP